MHSGCETVSPPPVAIVAVVGVTASGKSALAMDLAARIDSEIVCADSRTVYRELDIGSAKPSLADRQTVPHHLVDILDLDELLTAPSFCQLAEQAITACAGRGRLPLIVGGTRLFVNSLLYDLEFAPLTEAERIALEKEPVDAIHKRFHASGTSLPLNHLDRKTLIRALDGNRVGRGRRSRRSALVLGVRAPSSTEIVERVRARVDVMVACGLEQEVRQICRRHGRPARTLFSIGYEEWDPVFNGQGSLADAIDLIVENTLRYAIGQQQWLESFSEVCWVEGVDQAERLVRTFVHA